MRNQNITPYISVVFANRNDGYPSQQRERMQRFIDYYAYYSRKYPGLFEFVICDWNPPKDKALLQYAYDWSVLGNVKHVVVSPETHDLLCPEQNRPILDYIGRNVCARHASAPFILVINQDIYLSASIFSFFAKRKLSYKHFYRADRCDFKCDFTKNFDSWEMFEKYAKKQSFVKHIRQRSTLDQMSLTVDEHSFSKIYTKARFFEWKTNNVIYSDCVAFIQKVIRMIKTWPFQCVKNFSYKDLCLHTNASGDFFVIPKAAFEKVNGFVETSKFYMHLDSYMCVQLASAGYRQAILAYPHTVFHSDHPRGSTARSESMTYADHVKIFKDICLGVSSYAINDLHWGLQSPALSDWSSIKTKKW